jgi:hypothetical protein
MTQYTNVYNFTVYLHYTIIYGVKQLKHIRITRT